MARQTETSRNPMLLAAALMVALTLSACGEKKEAKPGQALVRVNGDEITVLQLNEELQRANVAPAQQEAVTPQLLESLIDRQLIFDAAVKEKVDRDPKVMQALERAKALIVAQAYLQQKAGSHGRPSKAEIDDYYQKHPEFFMNRKLLEMRQLVLASKDLTDEAKAAIDSAKSLDDAAAWMDQHKVPYARAQVAKATSELPAQLGAKLLTMPKGQLFIVKRFGAVNGGHYGWTYGSS